MRCIFAAFQLTVSLMLVIPVRSQFRFTLPPPADPSNQGSSSSTGVFEDVDGNPIETPRGIFHYSDTEQNVQSRFKIPDFQEMDPLRIAQDLMSAAAEAQTRRKTLGGFNIPLPIGATPMNLQVSSDTRKGVSLTNEKENKTATSSTVAGPTREAFKKAKAACLHSDAESCDEALDAYYHAKYGTSLMPSTSTAILAENPSTELAAMIVPGLGKKLDEMTTETENVEGPTTRPRVPFRRHPPSASSSRRPYSLPPRLPPRSSTTTVSKIRGFLHRIN